MSQSPEPLAAPADPSPEIWDEPAVAEVAGAPFTPMETAGAIGLGLVSLLIAGLMGLLLSALTEEHRLSASGIGLTAMLEALSMGVTTGLAGVVLKPKALRTVGALACVLLAAANLATFGASGGQVLAVRALAGVPEGLLLWIAVGLIARTATPERWAAVFFTGMGVSQLGAAAALTAFALPRYGANGGFGVVAAASLLGVGLALALPRAYGPTPGTEETSSGAPPLRGWIALIGTLGFSASTAAVSVYLVPLAREAGLSTTVGRTAVSVGLGCQILGGALATLLAGRARYVLVFWGCALAFLITWGSYALNTPAWWFVAVSGLGGVSGMLGGPFLVPMTIEADPSRRAAVQSGAVQVLAGALGPFLASLVVNDRDVRGVLPLGGVMLAGGVLVITALHQAAVMDRAAMSPR